MKEMRDSALWSATVDACLAVEREAKARATCGETSIVFHWTSTNKTLLSGTTYVGIAKDAEFRKGILSMLVADFGAPRQTTRVLPRARKRSATYRAEDFITVRMTWKSPLNRNVQEGSTSKAVSNVFFECPVCLENTRANILVPCGHHTCAPCVGKIMEFSTTKWCPTCKSPIARERTVYASTSKRERPPGRGGSSSSRSVATSSNTKREPTGLVGLGPNDNSPPSSGYDDDSDDDDYE